MEIIFLGTSSGVPTKSRNVSAVVLKKSNQKGWCLIDCGEATQQQILRTNLSLRHLEAVLITHIHGDHCYGLPGLIASASMTNRTKPLTIIAPKLIQQWIEATCNLTQLRLSYRLQFITVEEIKTYTLKQFDIDITPLSHRVASYAYGFTDNNQKSLLNREKLKAEGIAAGPIWGKLQNKQKVVLDSGKVLDYRDYLLVANPPRKIIVSGDNDQPNLLHQSVKNTDVLIHEATYTHDIYEKVGKTYQHSSAKMVAEFAQQASINNVILTHFSSRYQDTSELNTEAKQYYQGQLFLAHDFDHYRLTKEGELTLS